MLLKRLLCTLILLLIVGCTDDDDSFGPDDENNDSSDVSDGRSFSTDCGVVVNAELQNPTVLSSGELGVARAAGPNRVIFSSTTGDVLVKLHGIDDFTGSRAISAMSFLNSELRGDVYFFPAEENCTTVDGGGTAAVGQIVTSDGLSIGEELLRNGLIPVVDQNDACSGALIGRCYEALRQVGEQSGEEVSNFLWKPESERDGKLAILFSPSASSVSVNGDNCDLSSGPTNGRATTARCPRSGCGYGSNARVSALDSSGRPLSFQGSSEYVIVDGCQRVEF